MLTLMPTPLPPITELRRRLRAPGAHEALLQELIQRAGRPEAAAVFTTRFDDEALAVARRADALQAAGATLSALAGLPVTVKDL